MNHQKNIFLPIQSQSPFDLTVYDDAYIQWATSHYAILLWIYILLDLIGEMKSQIGIHSKEGPRFN